MYHYCSQMFEMLNFFDCFISPCCSIRNIKIPTYAFAGGILEIESYEEYLRSIMTGKHLDRLICRGCPNIKTTEKGLPSFKFKTLLLNMHALFCNCKCEYCIQWQQLNKKIPYDIMPTLKILHENGYLDQNALMNWGGGEPSIYRGFERISTWILEHGYRQHAYSNGIRFSPAISRLLETNNGRVNFSLDSGTRGTYEKIKGVDKFDKVISNIKRYRAVTNSRNIVLKYIIYERNNNFYEIQKFLELAQDLGVNEIHYSYNFNDARAGKISQETLRSAAFLHSTAEQLGFFVVPFLVDEPWLSRIKALFDSVRIQDYAAMNL